METENTYRPKVDFSAQCTAYQRCTEHWANRACTDLWKFQCSAECRVVVHRGKGYWELTKLGKLGALRSRSARSFRSSGCTPFIWRMYDIETIFWDLRPGQYICKSMVSQVTKLVGVHVFIFITWYARTHGHPLAWTLVRTYSLQTYWPFATIFVHSLYFSCTKHNDWITVCRPTWC